MGRKERMVFLQENWEDLANAIIIQAVKDYKIAYQRLLRHPESNGAQEEVRKLERFFYGRWYSQLTDVDPYYLLNRLKEAIMHDKLELSRQKRRYNQSAQGL